MASGNKFPKLFTPITIRGVEIKNRVVFLPHLTLYGSEDHLPTRKEVYYYRERAKGGAGLIVVPSMGAHPSGSYINMVSAFRKESIPGLRAIVDAVHPFGTKVFGQLTHMGNQGKSVETLQPLWAPSPIPDMTVREIPKEMSLEEIQELVESFALSAANLVQAGFDGVEIKVAHDGVLRQFLSPSKNVRTDQYGGSIENRARIVSEVLNAIREKIDDKPLGVRMCINEYIPGGYRVEDAIQFAKLFATVADYISSDSGTWESMSMAIPPMTIPQGFLLQDVARIKKEVDITIIGHNRIVWPAMAEEALANGYCDLIGMARALIADPFWAEKARNGAHEDIRGCIGCNQKCVGRLLQNLPIGCVQNPTSGHEEEYGVDVLYKKTDKAKKVVVVGGGPAGMKTSEILARKEHNVVLFEKESNVGGRVNWESNLPGRRGVSGVSRYLAHALEALNVEVKIGVEADEALILREKPDVVILASGATPFAPTVEGLDDSKLFDTSDVVAGKVEGDVILVMDNDATTEGAGVVELLLNKGKTVHWVTPVFFNGQDINAVVLLPYYERIGKKNIILHPMKLLLKSENKSATLFNPYFGTTTKVSGIDSVVVTGVKIPNNALYNSLKGRVPQVYIIGDAAAPRDIAAALTDAIGLKID